MQENLTMTFSNSVGESIRIQSLLRLCLFSVSLEFLTDNVNKLETKFQEKVTEKDAATLENIEHNSNAQINKRCTGRVSFRGGRGEHLPPLEFGLPPLEFGLPP